MSLTAVRGRPMSLTAVGGRPMLPEREMDMGSSLEGASFVNRRVGAWSNDGPGHELDLETQERGQGRERMVGKGGTRQRLHGRARRLR
jgi:hypothetical protein